MPDSPPPAELSAQDLAFKNEFESAASAAGLSPEEFALTSEGRAKGEDIGRRADAYENDSIGSSSDVTAVAEEGSDFESASSQSEIRSEEDKRNSELRALNEAAWNVEDGTGIADGDKYGYNSLSPDGMARPAIGAKAPEHVVASFIRDENGNIEIPSDWAFDGDGGFIYSPPGWEINDKGEYVDLGDEARRKASEGPRGYISESEIQQAGSKATDAQILGWQREDDGSVQPPPNWAVNGAGEYVYSPPETPEDKKAKREEAKKIRDEKLRGLAKAAWDPSNGTGVADGEGYDPISGESYNPVNPIGEDDLARPAIGAKAPDHVIASFTRDSEGNIEVPSDWSWDGKGGFVYDPPEWELNENGTYSYLGPNKSNLSSPRILIPESTIQERGSKANDDQIVGWPLDELGVPVPPPNWAVDGEGGYVYSPPDTNADTKSEMILASSSELEDEIGILPWNNPNGFFDGQLWWSSEADYLMAPKDEVRPIAGPGPQSISKEIKANGFFDGEFVWESEEQFIEIVVKPLREIKKSYKFTPEDKPIHFTEKDARGNEISSLYLSNPPIKMPEKGTKEYALLLKETFGESAEKDFDYKKYIAYSRRPKDYPDWLNPIYDIDERWIEENKINSSKVFSKNFEEYEFYKREDGSINIKTEFGFDEITGIPKLHFADKDVSAIAEIEATFDLVKAKDDVTGKMFRVYNAAFNRFPDSDGLEYWIEKNGSGENTERQVAESFLASNEFKEKYGENIDNGTYVNTLYKNILGREADTEGYNYWVGQLNNGVEDRSELLLGFAESAENKALFSEVTSLF